MKYRVWVESSFDECGKNGFTEEFEVSDEAQVKAEAVKVVYNLNMNRMCSEEWFKRKEIERLSPDGTWELLFPVPA